MAETATELTFEAGYERLQNIAARLNQDEVPVSEMCDLFAEGKGLETALTGFLETQRERIEAIEKGEGVRSFSIVAASTAAGSRPDQRRSEPSGLAASAQPVNPSEDDIPF